MMIGKRKGGNNVKVTFKDNSKKIESEMIKKKRKALEMIGAKWNEIVVKIITIKGIVDTGALRDSMGYRINSNVKAPILYVGSPKEYAPINELGGRTKNYPERPFLRPSVYQYGEVYKEIVKQVMEE